MDGEALEHLFRRHWTVEPADGRVIRSIPARPPGLPALRRADRDRREPGPGAADARIARPWAARGPGVRSSGRGRLGDRATDDRLSARRTGLRAVTVPPSGRLRLLVVLALVELVGGTVWHEPLRATTTTARQFWQRGDVQSAPLETWRALIDGVVVPASRAGAGPRSPLGPRAGELLRLVLDPACTLLARGGAAVLLVPWIAAYLMVALTLWGLDGAVALHLLPLAPVAVWALRRRRLPADHPGCLGRPPGPRVVPPSARIPRRTARGTGATVLSVMGPEHGALLRRIDPYTRTGFAPGEPFVRCGGGCGRAYKLSAWVLFEQQCPVDGAALAIGQDSVVPTVSAVDSANAADPRGAATAAPAVIPEGAT
jgi:hypothetical protein